MNQIELSLRKVALSACLVAMSVAAPIANARTLNEALAPNPPGYKRTDRPIYLKAGVRFTKYQKQNIQGKSLKAKSDSVLEVGAGWMFTNTRAELAWQLGGVNTFRLPNGNVISSCNWSWFMNGYYDFINETLQAMRLTPYVTAGLGTVSFSDSILTTGTPASTKYKDRTNFAWNAGLGLTVKLNNMLSVDVGYRYAMYGKYITGGGNLRGNQLMLAVLLNV